MFTRPPHRIAPQCPRKRPGATVGPWTPTGSMTAPTRTGSSAPWLPAYSLRRGVRTLYSTGPVVPDRPGGVVEHEVAVILDNEANGRGAVRPREPQSPRRVNSRVFHEIAVSLHGQDG